MALQDNSFDINSQNNDESNNLNDYENTNEKEDKKSDESGNEKLNAKELNEVKAVAGALALATAGTIPEQVTEEVAKKDPEKYRKLKNIVKKGLPIAIVISILIPIFFLILQAAPALAIIAVIQSVVHSQSTDANGPPPISTEEFYGVRIFYKNNELSNKTLMQSYNELAFEFLNSVGSMDGVKSLTLELPETIEGADFTSFSTDITNEMVYKIVESVLNNQNLENKEEGAEDPLPVSVTQENLIDSLIKINHFGFTFSDYEKIRTELTEYFVNKVEAGVNTTDNSNDDILTFNDGYTFDKSTFTTNAATLLDLQKFNRFKISAEKIYVKDILAGSEAGINVNGVITHYVYMSKKEVDLKDRHYGIDIKDDSKYSVSFVQNYEGVSYSTQPQIADKTWVQTGAEIKANNSNIGNAGMFLKDDARYFNTQIELSNEITCPAFNNFDTSNTEFLVKEDLSVLNAYSLNETSANVCFEVIIDEDHADFISIDHLPSVMVGLVFEDVSENAIGTSFILADLE